MTEGRQQDDVNREQDRAETLRAGLEKIATGQGSGATPFDNWTVCKQLAEDTLVSVFGPRRAWPQEEKDSDG